MNSKKQLISGFGQYPIISSDVFRPEFLEDLQKIIKDNDHILATGSHKSYGDASLYGVSIDMHRLDNVLSFNKKSGIMKVQGGMVLGDLLEIIVPHGWFIPVTPGTKFVTLAGCVASNVHGKNHHSFGSFGQGVLSLEIVTAEGKLEKCSRERHKVVFLATLGGMGLTGVIYSVELALKKIGSSSIDLEQVKCSSLDEVFSVMDKMDKAHDYTVTWLDSMSSGKSLGRGIVMGGDHSKSGALKVHSKFQIPIPFRFPNFVLNNLSIKLFNMVYYFLGRTKKAKVHYNGFFYPLDIMKNWNLMYGKRGFTQYQLVLPLKESLEGIKEVLLVLSHEKCGSFLTVLKKFKKEDGLLSFPTEGYTLNLDFPLSEKTRRVCKILDGIVKKRGGRLYLTKDILMDKSMLEAGYPKLKDWKTVKKVYDPHNKFTSLQAKRLGL